MEVSPCAPAGADDRKSFAASFDRKLMGRFEVGLYLFRSELDGPVPGALFLRDVLWPRLAAEEIDQHHHEIMVCQEVAHLLDARTVLEPVDVVGHQ